VIHLTLTQEQYNALCFSMNENARLRLKALGEDLVKLVKEWEDTEKLLNCISDAPKNAK